MAEPWAWRAWGRAPGYPAVPADSSASPRSAGWEPTPWEDNCKAVPRRNRQPLDCGRSGAARRESSDKPGCQPAASRAPLPDDRTVPGSRQRNCHTARVGTARRVPDGRPVAARRNSHKERSPDSVSARGPDKPAQDWWRPPTARADIGREGRPATGRVSARRADRRRAVVAGWPSSRPGTRSPVRRKSRRAFR